MLDIAFSSCLIGIRLRKIARSTLRPAQTISCYNESRKWGIMSSAIIYDGKWPVKKKEKKRALSMAIASLRYKAISGVVATAYIFSYSVSK